MHGRCDPGGQGFQQPQVGPMVGDKRNTLGHEVEVFRSSQKKEPEQVEEQNCPDRSGKWRGKTTFKLNGGNMAVISS